MNQQKMFMYGAVVTAVLGFIITITSGGAGLLGLIGGLFAAIGAVFAVLVIKYGYLIIPLITQRTKTVLLTDTGYEIPSSQDVIVKNVNGVYYATAFLVVKVYESTTEKTTEETLAYNEFFERAISNMKYVTKISLLLYVEEIGERRKLLEAKRAEAQLRLAREREKTEADVLKVDKLEREVAFRNAQLNEIIKGVKPMGLVAYAMTTAAELSKDAAIATVKGRANELKSILANSLNVEVDIVTGDQMYKCFEWEKFLPTSPQELEEAVS